MPGGTGAGFYFWPARKFSFFFCTVFLRRAVKINLHDHLGDGVNTKVYEIKNNYYLLLHPKIQVGAGDRVKGRQKMDGTCYLSGGGGRVDPPSTFQIKCE